MPSCCGRPTAIKTARSSARVSVLNLFVAFFTLSPHTTPLLPIFSRLDLAHPVCCFCKVGVEEVWAGTFDSIIMLSNEGHRLHSTSTGAGRMIYIRQGALSCALQYLKYPEYPTHKISHLCRYVWSGGGVSTSDLLASSSIFQWAITHPPTGQHFKLGTRDHA